MMRHDKWPSFLLEPAGTKNDRIKQTDGVVMRLWCLCQNARTKVRNRD